MTELCWRIGSWTQEQIFCVEKAALDAMYEVYEDEKEQALIIITEGQKETQEFFVNTNRLLCHQSV